MLAFQDKPSLGVDAPHFKRFRHSVNRYHIGRDAVVDLVSFRILYHDIEGIHHYVHQPLIDFTFAPEKTLAVLYPFEVADGHTARISQNVWDGEHALAVQDGVRLPGRWAIRALDRKSTRL